VRLTRILHHSVNAEGRLDETRAFYRDVLGLDAVPRPEIPGVAGAWFEVADAQVHLVDADPGEQDIRPTDAHVCFGVEDLDAAIAELQERDIPHVRGAQGPVVQIWIADPAGNTIELQQDPLFGQERQPA
jgi:lactoylglutathione lyase